MDGSGELFTMHHRDRHYDGKASDGFELRLKFILIDAKNGGKLYYKDAEIEQRRNFC